MRYLDYDKFSAMIAEVGLETTPIIYRGPWIDKEKMYSLAQWNLAIPLRKPDNLAVLNSIVRLQLP